MAGDERQYSEAEECADAPMREADCDAGERDLLLRGAKTIGSLLRNFAEEDPDRSFVFYPDRGLHWTYDQFDRRSDEMARGLLAIGVHTHDRLGIGAFATPDWLTFLFACAKIGVAFMGMNPAFREDELGRMVQQSEVKAFCAVDRSGDDDCVDFVRELIPESLVQERGHLNVDRYPALESLIYVGPEKHRGFYSTPELLLLGSHAAEAELWDLEQRCSDADTAVVQFDAGANQLACATAFSHRQIIDEGFSVGEQQGIAPGDCVCLPVASLTFRDCVLGASACVSHHATMVVSDASGADFDDFGGSKVFKSLG